MILDEVREFKNDADRKAEKRFHIDVRFPLPLRIGIIQKGNG